MTRLNRRDFIKRALAASVGIATLQSKDPAAQPVRDREQPNLLFVFPDEMRRQAVACMGEDPVITPNLDRLAREGLVFNSAVSNCPICSPYRSMLLTGKYPFNSGVITNCNSGEAAKTSFLRPDEQCISDVLHEAGYSLGYVGKWHLDRPREPYLEQPREDGLVWDAYAPPERRHGFDYWHSYGCFDNHLGPHYWTNESKRDGYTTFREWSPKHEAEVAVEYIENRGGKYRDAAKPFALFVSNNPPHMPFHLVPERYVQMYGDATARDLLTRPNVDLSLDEGPTGVAKRCVKHYFAAITGVDEQFGRILDCLERQGLKDDTIVVFTSDHGEMMGSHDRIYKSLWYEESLTVPFIIRWPGNIKPGREDLLLSAPDVMPTLLGLLGLGGKVPEGVQGADHSGILLGRQSGARPDSALYLIVTPPAMQRGRRGLRTPRYTFVVDRTGSSQELVLHDNEKDRYQLRNIATDSTPLVAELTRQLNDWLARTRDPWQKV